MIADCEDNLEKTWDSLEDDDRETKATGEDGLKCKRTWDRPEDDDGGVETKANREVGFEKTYAQDRYE